MNVSGDLRPVSDAPTKQFGVLVALELVMTAIVGVDSKEK
jgi:hypothetical protein